MQEKNYYKEALDRLRAKREAAEARSEERKLELWAKLPEIQEIDLELSKTAVKMFAALGKGQGSEDEVEAVRLANKALRKKREEILIANGYEKDYSDIKYHCEKCADSGYVDINMCDCTKREIALARLEDSELGRLCRFQSFESFNFDYYKSGEEMEQAKLCYNALSKFAEEFNSKTDRSFLLIGNTGLGKTHLSTAVGVRVIERGYDVIYKSIQSIIDDYEQVQFRGESSATTRKYYDCDLLIIDDLGVEMTNSFTLSCLYNIINTRLNKGRSTIISTNLTMKELRLRYEDRITSRLFGEYRPMTLIGTDVRRQRLGKNSK